MHSISNWNQNVVKIAKKISKYFLKLDNLSSVRGTLPPNPDFFLMKKFQGGEGG